MANIEITFPDQSSIEKPSGISAGEVLSEINPKLAKKAFICTVDGELKDLSCKLDEDCSIEFLTFDDPRGKDIYRHSSAHVMAQAVLELFPETKLAIGPAIEDGFYYDFDRSENFTEEDLVKIEEKMAEIVKRDIPVQRHIVPKSEALEELKAHGERYKIELVENIDDETISFYSQGDFKDLCRGPHLPSTGWLKAFKLLSIAGAYWRGSELNPQLQRIYGTSFWDPKELKAYLNFREEAKKRDHRRIGKELELFTQYEACGPGLVFYHPKGALVKRTLEQWLTDQHLSRGYEIVCTPHIFKVDTWKISGHYDTGYPMFFTEIDGNEYGIKPMNCPGHIMIYQSKIRSYRDLPYRMFELGTVYRGERAGVLHGLLRVRGFTQDDAHIFCTPEQLKDEIVSVLNFAQDMLKGFGFTEFKMFLATKPEKAVGSDEIWEKATKSLVEALEECKLPYEDDPGGGAFYGPKIDVKLKDAIGRLWQGPTIQCDFNLAERFNLEYIGEDGNAHRPVMVHRVVLAGIERFLGILTEHYSGAFPVWLAPVQVKILPITDEMNEYGDKLLKNLREYGIKAELDNRNEKINYKIRSAEKEKVPYMFVIGKKELEQSTVSVRKRGKKDLGVMAFEEIVKIVKEDIETHKLD